MMPTSPDARRLAAAGEMLYGPRWQSPLARAAGIPQSLLSMISGGARPMTDDVRRRIVAALKTEAARLRLTADKLDRLLTDIEAVG